MELKLRVQGSYAEHCSAIFDCFLLQFRLPEETDGSHAKPRSDPIAAGFSALLGFAEINRVLDATEGPSPVKVKTAIRYSNAAADYSSWVRKLLLDTFTAPRSFPPPLSIFNGTTTFYASLFRTFPRLLVLLSSQSSMLEVAIAWWTVLHRGSPPLYPGGERSRDPDEDSVGDLATMLVHTITKENPKGMAAAILNGKVCDLATFAERTIQRMWCLLRIKQLQHLADFPEATVENANLRYLVTVTNFLMEADPRIHEAFMKAHVASAYITVLSSTTARVYGRIRPHLKVQDRRKLTRQITEIVDLARFPVQWVSSTPARARKNMVDVVKGGFAVLADCVLFLDEKDTVFESIFDALKVFAPNRKVYPTMASGLTTICKRADGLPDTSARRIYLGTSIHYTSGWSELLVDERQESLCDNLKVSRSLHEVHFAYLLVLSTGNEFYGTEEQPPGQSGYVLVATPLSIAR